MTSIWGPAPPWGHPEPEGAAKMPPLHRHPRFPRVRRVDVRRVGVVADPPRKRRRRGAAVAAVEAEAEVEAVAWEAAWAEGSPAGKACLGARTPRTPSSGASQGRQGKERPPG